MSAKRPSANCNSQAFSHVLIEAFADDGVVLRCPSSLYLSQEAECTLPFASFLARADRSVTGDGVMRLCTLRLLGQGAQRPYPFATPCRKGGSSHLSQVPLATSPVKASRCSPAHHLGQEVNPSATHAARVVHRHCIRAATNPLPRLADDLSCQSGSPKWCRFRARPRKSSWSSRAAHPKGAASAATRSDSTFPSDKKATVTSRSAIGKIKDLLDELGRNEGTARTDGTSDAITNSKSNASKTGLMSAGSFCLNTARSDPSQGQASRTPRGP